MDTVGVARRIGRLVKGSARGGIGRIAVLGTASPTLGLLRIRLLVLLVLPVRILLLLLLLWMRGVGRGCLARLCNRTFRLGRWPAKDVFVRRRALVWPARVWAAIGRHLRKRFAPRDTIKC